MHERGNVTSDPGFATAIQHPPRHPQLLRGQGLVAAGSGQHLFDDPILQIGQRLSSDPKADVDVPGIGSVRLNRVGVQGRRDRYR